MKYFRPKTSAATTSKRRAAAPEEGAGSGAGAVAGPLTLESQSSGASANRPHDKQKDPYRKKTGWKRPKKPAQATAEPQPARFPEGAGDVEIANSDEAVGRQDEAVGGLPMEGELARVEYVNREQQTSTTCFELDQDQLPLEEAYSVPILEEDENEGGEPSAPEHPDVGEEEECHEDLKEDDVSARLSAHLTGLASVVGLAEPSSQAVSSVASEDSQGFRNWQRGLLTRLSRARKKRDIRFSRKEVLNLQLLMEAVLKQHMALSRDVDSVKANLQWESVEPVSLSRALSRLQSERQEEAASFARTLAAKEKNIVKLNREVQVLRSQVSELGAVCKEKDADIEKAAVAMATFRCAHQRMVQEIRVAEEERLEAALDKAQQARELEAQAYEERILRLQQTVGDLKTRMQAEASAFKQSLDEKHAQLSGLTAERATRQADIASLQERLRAKDADIEDLRAELVKAHSDHNMECLNLSRALTEKEGNIARLMDTVERLNGERLGEVKALREEVREHERMARTLQQEKLALERDVHRLVADREEMLVVMSKALSAGDSDTAHLRDEMGVMRKEHEQQQQSLRGDLEMLRSEKDVMALNLQQTINDKDIRISGLLLEIEKLRATVVEKDLQVKQVDAGRMEAKKALQITQEEHAELVKTVEAMNAEQRTLTERLHEALDQLDSTRKELGVREVEEVRLRKVVEETATHREGDADHFRKALHEKDVQLRELQDQFVNFRKEREQQVGVLMKQLLASEGSVEEKVMRARSQVQGELAEKEKAVTKLRGKLARLEESEARIDSEREALSRALQDKEDEVKVLKNSVEQMKVRHKESSSKTKSDLEKKTKEVVELTKSVQSLRAALNQAKGEQREAADLRQRREAELEKALKAAEKARQQSEETAGQLKKAVSKLTAEQAKAGAEVSDLKADIKHYAMQRAGYVAVIEEKDKEIAALNDKYKLLRSKVQSDQEMLCKSAEDRAAESARLQSALEEAHEARTALQRKVSKMFKVVRASFLRRSAERASLEEELAKVRAQADRFRETLQTHEAEKDKLTRMILGKENEARQLRENLHQYEAHLRATKDEMDACVDTWKRRAQELERQVKELQAEVRDQGETEARLQASMAEDRSRLEREVEAERRKWQSAQEEREELDREVQKLRVQSRAHEAEHQRLQAALEEIERLRTAQQELQHHLHDVEQSRDALRAELEKRTSELELELDLGRKLLKKSVEEHRLRTEKLQQAVENARQERDTEVAMLRETVARLEAQANDQMHYCEAIKVERAAELLSLHVALDSRSEEVEKLKKQSDEHASKEIELRQRIEYLEDDLNHDREALADRKKEVAQLQEEIATLKSGLDYDLLQAKTQLDSSEGEKLQLQSKVSMLEAQLEDHVSLMARKLTDRDDAIRELSEAKDALRVKYESANKDLAEESQGLLEVLSRMQADREQCQYDLDNAMKQKDSELQALIQTMNGALRAKDEELKQFKDSAEETVSLRRQVDELEGSLKSMVSSLQTNGLTILREPQVDVLNLTTGSLKDLLLVLNEKVQQNHQERESVEKQLKEREAEVRKLAQMMEALKVELNMQKQLLLAFDEGRAYLGASSDHATLSKVIPALTGLRKTAERTLLAQDGDHQDYQQRVQSHRKHVFPIGELKRTASEGDHLDDLALDYSFLSGSTTPSEMTLTGLGSPSELSTASHNPTATS